MTSDYSNYESCKKLKQLLSNNCDKIKWLIARLIKQHHSINWPSETTKEWKVPAAIIVARIDLNVSMNRGLYSSTTDPWPNNLEWRVSDFNLILKVPHSITELTLVAPSKWKYLTFGWNNQGVITSTCNWDDTPWWFKYNWFRINTIHFISLAKSSIFAFSFSFFKKVVVLSETMTF